MFTSLSNNIVHVVVMYAIATLFCVDQNLSPIYKIMSLLNHLKSNVFAL
jgi:hypothetical protein